MSRIRYLKPEFFEDEDLAEHDFWVRLLFAGLWNIADKEGRLPDRAKWIKAKIFPYDNIDIEKGLNKLSNGKTHGKFPFLQRYEIENERYIQIINWHRHQKPHHTEKESSISPPLKNPPLKEKIKEKIKGKENQLKASTELSNGFVTVTKELEEYLSNKFNEFWNIYPKKENKKDAKKAWGQVFNSNHKDYYFSKLTDEIVTEIVISIEKRKETEEWKKENGQYIPHPGTWLRYHRWEDESKKAEKRPWED